MYARTPGQPASQQIDQAGPVQQSGAESVFRKHILCIHACSTPAKQRRHRPATGSQDVKLQHLNNFV